MGEDGDVTCCWVEKSHAVFLLLVRVKGIWDGRCIGWNWDTLGALNMDCSSMCCCCCCLSHCLYCQCLCWFIHCISYTNLSVLCNIFILIVLVLSELDNVLIFRAFGQSRRVWNPGYDRGTHHGNAFQAGDVICCCRCFLGGSSKVLCSTA